MRKIYLLSIIFIACFFNSYAQSYQYTETFTTAFTNPNAVGFHDYTLLNIVGGANMNCTICTNATNITLPSPRSIDGVGVFLERNNTNPLAYPTLNMVFPNGVAEFSFQVTRGHQVLNSIQVGLFHGNTLLTTSPVISATNNDTYTVTYNVNLSGVVNLVIREISGSDTSIQNKNTVIDNVKWNEYTTASLNDNNISGLSIYPNPANSVININSNLSGSKSVVIFNVLGKQVLRATTDQVLNISSLSSGVYMVKVTQDGKTATRKLVIK